MTTPDTAPTIEDINIVQYLKTKKDFISQTDNKFSGLNDEHAYVVRYADLVICLYCAHGQLYVREEPRPDWPADVMISVMLAYGFSGLIPAGDMVACTDAQMVIACLAHGLNSDKAGDAEIPDMLELAKLIIRSRGE